jgi:hypothetical protein
MLVTQHPEIVPGALRIVSFEGNFFALVLQPLGHQPKADVTENSVGTTAGSKDARVLGKE